MTFSPSLQSISGAHTTASSLNNQCAVDWVNNRAYINGYHGSGYLTSNDLLAGTEIAYALVSAYSVPSGSPNQFNPTGIDANGDVYIAWNNSNGGGLIQIDGTTLAEITNGGADALPPNGFFLQGGYIVNVPVGTTQFMLCAESGITGFFQHFEVFNGVTFAGRYQSYTGDKAFVCPGKSGSATGFVVSSLSGGSHVYLKSISFATGGGWVIGNWPTQNSSIAVTDVVTIVPTDIDMAWSTIVQDGICVDQTDGHPIVIMTGDAGSTRTYAVKLNKTTGAIVWQRGLATGVTAGAQLAFSNISHQRLALLHNGSVQIINTSDGTSTTSSSGLAGVSCTSQCYNDTLGAILFAGDYSKTTGSPTQLNSTPNSFSGWGMLYVAAPFSPPLTAGSDHGWLWMAHALPASS